MKIINLVLLIIILSGCNREIKTGKSIDLRGILNNKSTTIPLSDIIESEMRISLETSDSVLIGHINNIIVDNYLLYVMHGSKCSVFDKSGKFLYRIGNRGQGPREYVSISKILITDDKIFIHDRNQNKMLAHDKKGKFINRINIPYNFLQIEKIENNNFIGYAPNISGSERMKFGIFNDSGILLDSILYTTQFEPKMGLLFADEGQFFRSDKKLYFKEYLNDTIYYIKNGRLEPHLYFELGDQRAREFARAELVKYSKYDSFFPNMAMINIFGETERFLFLGVKSFVCYDKKNKTCNRIEIKYNDLKLRIFRISDDNKYLITHRTMDNDDNPEVILLKIKD